MKTITAELVTAWHPDKICDQISDAIVDACLIGDPNSRVAVECIGGHNTLVLVGEVTTKADIDFAAIAREVYLSLTNKHIGVLSNIVKQAPEISNGVDKGGAGDQGIMVGYACNETKSMMPIEIQILRDILRPFKTDAKAQVTIESYPEKKETCIESIVLSVQGKTREQLEAYLSKWTGLNLYYLKPKIYCNNTGSFETGGFDADSGCTGRKIVVDAYGPRVPVGGGAFSGKDATKVDRSGAYMARWIAKDILKKAGAQEVLVKLGYVIGGAKPLMQTAIVDGKEFNIIKEYDCRPQAIIERFNLRKPIYFDTAHLGHFGRSSLPWEQLNGTN